MSTYIRKPKKTVAHCKVCPWFHIYFETEVPSEVRAWLGLRSHMRKHKSLGAANPSAQGNPLQIPRAPAAPGV